ncbi:MAG TPA: serine/threonine-protein kinase [Kofleriaceae bacterium]
MRLRGARPTPAAGSDYPELSVVDPTHYALGREIARGGMGRIWVARDRRLGREVALKEVLGASPAVLRRFEREARITARLQHPSIVSVYEAGAWPSGEPFYAMRLVSGQSLDEAIAAARGFDQRLALLPNLLAVADAMAYAHGQKVIHRDLKPRNVVVGEFGETVVIDWGLAKDLRDAGASSLDGAAPASVDPPSSSSAPGETTAGDVLGTPSYMPVEQAAGQAVDERVDVYAIGAMLYHVLAGEPPYREPTSAEVIAAVMTGPPPPIRERAPETPGELVAILERAMARERDGRYATARELADDLRRFQTGQLVGAHHYSLRQLLRRWIRRHRTALAAVAAALVVAAVVGVIALRRVLEADRVIEQQRGEAIANRKSAEELAQFMMDDLKPTIEGVGRLDLLETVARRLAAYYELRAAAGDDDEDRFELAQTNMTIARVHSLRGQVAEARASFVRAFAIASVLAARHPEAVKYAALGLQAWINVVNLDAERGLGSPIVDLQAIAASADQLIARQPGDAGALDVATACHQEVAALLANHGDPVAGLAEASRALAIATTLEAVRPHGQSDVVLCSAHTVRGDLLHDGHDDDAALVEYRAALALLERQKAGDGLNTKLLGELAGVHRSIADILISRHDLAGAASELQAGLAGADRLHAIDPSDRVRYFEVQQFHERMGMVLAARHEFAGALAQYRTCEAVLHELVAKEPNDLDYRRDLGLIDDKLGEMLVRLTRLPEALAVLQQALASRRELVAKQPDNGQWHRDLFYNSILIGVTYSQMPGHKQDALASVRDALATATDNAAQHPASIQYAQDLVQSHQAVGEALADLRDMPGARGEYQIGIALAEHAAAQPRSDPRWQHILADLRTGLAAIGSVQLR